MPKKKIEIAKSVLLANPSGEADSQIESLGAWLNTGRPVRTRDIARMTQTSVFYWHDLHTKGKGPLRTYIGNQCLYMPEHFKEWLDQRSAASSSEAIARGLSQPCKRKDSSPKSSKRGS